MSKKRQRRITNEKRNEYRKIDPLWGTQALCPACHKCYCETCHPEGPCAYKKSNKEKQMRLTKVERFNIIFLAAVGLFNGDKWKAEQWINTPQISFENKTPKEMIRKKDGFDKILQLIGRLEHGIPS